MARTLLLLVEADRSCTGRLVRERLLPLLSASLRGMKSLGTWFLRVQRLNKLLAVALR